MHSVYPCLIVFDVKDSWPDFCSSQIILIKKMLISPGIGERLREERDRLAINQTDFGAAAGVSRGTQKAYELETSAPDTRYLCALQGMGVDVHFVLTGATSQVEASSISTEEADLLKHYRQLPEADRTGAAKMITALAAMAGRYEVKKTDSR